MNKFFLVFFAKVVIGFSAQMFFPSNYREDNAMFLVECPGGRRTREVLEKIIVEHVEPGTTIFTDCWAAYNHLEELGISRIFAFQN